ncbi:hypothetical protein SBA4_3320004 [Candidatus Sulfopaludibacter sp. SbA4]|nr:hypothetical protein SBA4_3320004 [Candidatus Sulfopaludibacter sp. SbA4]
MSADAAGTSACATLRILRVPLLTSDQRIIDSNLVPVIE